MYKAHCALDERSEKNKRGREKGCAGDQRPVPTRAFALYTYTLLHYAADFVFVRIYSVYSCIYNL